MSNINNSLSNQKQELLKLLLQKKGINLTSGIIKRRSPSQIVPLSFAQARLWFLSQLEGGSTSYNLPFTVLLKGNLNLDALKRAIAEIIQRHEVLRTRFQVENNTPIQIIDAAISPTWSVVDLQDLPADEQLITAQQLVNLEITRPFDLANGPLVRSHLWQMSQQSQVLLINMHHIVSDGWSTGILIQELSTLYQAVLSGTPNPLPELPIQYGDFAIWQRQWLTGEVLEKQLSYWKHQLASATPLLKLPTDRPRPPIQSFRGGFLAVPLDSDLSEKLKTLSQKSGTTLFMTMFAAFVTLLFRYTGQDDILVGSPVANRNRTETEPLIGFFVNTVVLRTDLTGNPSFSDLLSQVKKVAADAQAHQDVPFEQVVSALLPERNLSYSPLFQVMFDLQHSSSMGQLELPGVVTTPLPIEIVISKFDLSLGIEERGEELVSCFEYSNDLFDTDTIVRMAGHFQTLLTAIVANPDQAIGKLPLLTEKEQHQLLVGWNQTHSDYPENKCIHQLFEEQVQRSPDAIALEWEDEQLTYQQLNAKANQLAHYLQTLGVGPEVLVGIYLERSSRGAASRTPLTVIALLAILKAGGAYLPLDPNYPQERLADILDDAQVSVLLTQKKLLEFLPELEAKIGVTELGYEYLTQRRIRVASRREGAKVERRVHRPFPQVPEIILLDADLQVISAQSQENPVSDIKPENLAYVIYTSGSTGKPKGVMIPHQSLVNHGKAMIGEYGITSHDRVLQFASFSFDVAAEEIFPTWLSGATLVMRPTQMFASFAEFAQFLAAENVTVVNLPTPYWQEWVLELSQGKSTIPQSLRLVVTGSEQVLPERLALWQQLVNDSVMWVNAYGITETTITATVYQPIISSNLATTNSVSIGRPIANTQIYILDHHLQPLPIGVPGELHIGGAGLARGYLNLPELTAEKFIQHPQFNRLYKTGDLARYLPDGNIEFLGRIDHQVKIRGFRIEIGEIEALLAEHPQIRSSAVIVREDNPGNKQLVAYVVPQKQSNIQTELRSFFKQKLPNYMIPAFFVMLESLPLTNSGKVDRRALLASGDVTSNIATENFVLPHTPIQEIVAGIWRDVLKLEQVGIHDNFFELGGHSLATIQVISRLREAFEIDLPVRYLFEEPTVAALANALTSILQTETSVINTNTEDDFLLDTILDPTIQPQNLDFEYSNAPKNIFLTGVTGFLGAYLLDELLEQTNANIYCLIRSADVTEAMQKLQSKLEAFGIWDESKSKRIMPIVGDLSQNLLGLSPSQFRFLAGEIDVIYHNGASINTIYPYEILKGVNVLGTQEILRLASEIKVKSVHYISTTSVFSAPAYSGKIVKESDSLDHGKGMKNGYCQSKWVAEKLVMQARDRGIPTSVYRLARISGHSQTGVSNPDDLFCRLIKGCIQLGVAPNLDGAVDNITPVDYVSRAIVHLSQQKESLGKAFHLLNPDPTPMNDLFSWIRGCGYPLEEVSVEKWRSHLTSIEQSSDNVLQPLIPLYTENSLEFVPEPEFDCQNTYQKLANADIVLPTVDQKLLDIYFSYFINSGFLDRQEN
jgi:amino acid adenylation domain-containing protein/thioester reductase-like protein